MKKGILGKLFLSTLYLSTFTFGGGYVIITLMKKKFVDEYHWIDEQEMLDMTAIAQSSPGAIAVNGAIIVGYRIAGITGAAVAILGTILPPFLILSVISLFYTAFRDNVFVGMAMNGMLAAVAAVICDVVLSMGRTVLQDRKLLYAGLMAGCFLASEWFQVNILLLLVVCGAAGAADVLHERRKERLA